ncbi:hypothetical protein FPV67DRAFT_1669316 [Lyophyllum atratum]|nr:hypothetical protein FPV67DRAFT_1669316 [Lyophyllum atratum]
MSDISPTHNTPTFLWKAFKTLIRQHFLQLGTTLIAGTVIATTVFEEIRPLSIIAKLEAAISHVMDRLRDVESANYGTEELLAARTKLLKLHQRAIALREAASGSPWRELCAFFMGSSLEAARCLWEIYANVLKHYGLTIPLFYEPSWVNQLA